jgi:hypothetical protein
MWPSVLSASKSGAGEPIDKVIVTSLCQLTAGYGEYRRQEWETEPDNQKG